VFVVVVFSRSSAHNEAVTTSHESDPHMLYVAIFFSNDAIPGRATGTGAP
jgi:hypothetical protein